MASFFLRCGNLLSNFFPQFVRLSVTTAARSASLGLFGLEFLNINIFRLVYYNYFRQCESKTETGCPKNLSQQPVWIVRARNMVHPIENTAYLSMLALTARSF